MKPTTSQSQLFSTSEFGFGIWNATDETQYFEQINNDDESLYGIYQNTTKVTLDFKGVGLPTTSFFKFVNLLDIAAAGQTNCARTQGGFCILPKTCDTYPSLWDYSFKVAFTGNDNFLVVPLASFAADQIVKGDSVCVIYVEMLDESLADSLQIIFGQMFFQSFAYFSQGGSLAQEMTLAVNVNALFSTYLGQNTYTQSETNPFEIVAYDVPVDTYSTIVGIPTVSASISGISSDTNPYYTIDFSNDYTVVWTSDCQQTISQPTGSCFDAPTYV